MAGRTDNDVKNHWNTKLKKKILAGKVSLINRSNKNDKTTTDIVQGTITPSIPDLGDSVYRNSSYFTANSGTLSYENDIIYQQINLGPHKGTILDPNQVTFSGVTGVSDYHTSANNSYSSMSLSQEASSLSNSSSLTMESNYVSWSANGVFEEQGSLMDLSFDESPYYELLLGFDFQKASTEIDPDLGNYCPFRS